MQTIHSFSMKMYSKRRIAKKLLIEARTSEDKLNLDEIDTKNE